MAESVQRRLTAIVSADVVGYTRLMEADEVGTHARLKARFSELVGPKIAEHGGRIVKLMGDGLLAEFPSAINAVDWAVEVQAKVAEFVTNERDEQRIAYRVGINLGDIIVDGDDIFGDGVNVAARLQEIAEPGGICISEKVHVEVRGKLGVAFADGGAQLVKNVAQPIHVWRWSPNGQEPVQHLADEQEAALPLPDKPSIAVLPFDNMSTDPDQEYFADGLTEDIITTLSKISNLFVIARNSSFAFKGQGVDVREVARKLGVRYVLEGSVRAAGQRLRVTAQLIDAVDGRHLWADRFDRQMKDIFDIQDEIMREIVTALRIKLLDGEQAQIWLRGTNNIDAWINALQGVDLALQGAANTVTEGRRLLERAIAIDPDYATAHAWIGFSHFVDGHFGYSDDPKSSFRLAIEAADRALSIDPNSVHGLLAKGGAEVQLGLSD